MMKLSNILEEGKKLINDQITKEDIFILIEDIFHLERYEIIMKKDIDLDESKILPLFERLKSEPISYILNKRTFDQHEFYVDSRVLIPRDETEELVYLVKKEIEKNKLKNITVLDMGTGSGCIAISLDLFLKKQNIPHRVIACDKISDALEVAKINNKKNNSNVDFFISDIFENINEKVDILVSNPPYIAKKEQADMRVVINEPNTALFASEEGTYFYHNMLKNLQKIAFPKLIFFEISPEQVDILKKLAEKYAKGYHYEFVCDMNENVRFMKLERRL